MPNQPDLLQLKKLASQIRRDIVRMVHACQSGHPGGSLLHKFCMTCIHILKHNPKFNMDATGKTCSSYPTTYFTCLYSTLARSGYFDVKEIAPSGKARINVCKVTLLHMSICREFAFASGSLVKLVCCLSQPREPPGWPLWQA